MVSKMVDGNAGLDLQECSDCGEELALPGLPQCARCVPDSYLPLVEDAATASEVLSHIYALDDPDDDPWGVFDSSERYQLAQACLSHPNFPVGAFTYPFPSHEYWVERTLLERADVPRDLFELIVRHLPDPDEMFHPESAENRIHMWIEEWPEHVANLWELTQTSSAIRPEDCLAWQSSLAASVGDDVAFREACVLAVLHRKSAPEFLAAAASDPDFMAPDLIAWNPTSPPAVLEALAHKHSDPDAIYGWGQNNSVLRLLGLNATTPDHVRAALALSEDDSVREAVRRSAVQRGG